MRIRVAVTIALALGGCVHDPAPSASGQLTAVETNAVVWQFEPDAGRCQSGDAHEFLGVDLYDQTRALRLVAEPDGSFTLVVADSGDLARPTVAIAQAACRTFAAQLSRPEDEDDDAVSGAFTIYCDGLTVGPLSSIQGAITFASCDDGYD